MEPAKVSIGNNSTRSCLRPKILQCRFFYESVGRAGERAWRFLQTDNSGFSNTVAATFILTRAEQLWQMNGTEILENSQMAVVTAGWHLVI